MAKSLEELNMCVTEAIFRAEHEPEDSPGAEAAYRKLSELEEEIARLVPANELQGGLARVGAVTAALQAGDWLRAVWLAQSFAVGAPTDIAEQLGALAHDAEVALCGIAEPDVRPIPFDFAA